MTKRKEKPPQTRARRFEILYGSRYLMPCVFTPGCEGPLLWETVRDKALSLTVTRLLCGDCFRAADGDAITAAIKSVPTVEVEDNE